MRGNDRGGRISAVRKHDELLDRAALRRFHRDPVIQFQNDRRVEEFRWLSFDFGGIRNLRMKERTGEILLVVRLSLLGVSCCRTVWRRRPSLDSAKRMTDDDGHQIQSCPCLCLLVFKGNKGRWFGVQLLSPRATSTSLDCRRCGVEEGRGSGGSQQT